MDLLPSLSESYCPKPNPDAIERIQVEYRMSNTEFRMMKFDIFIRSSKSSFSVIPAKAGIQFFHRVANTWTPVTLSRRKPGTGVTTYY